MIDFPPFLIHCANIGVARGGAIGYRRNLIYLYPSIETTIELNEIDYLFGVIQLSRNNIQSYPFFFQYKSTKKFMYQPCLLLNWTMELGKWKVYWPDRVFQPYLFDDCTWLLCCSLLGFGRVFLKIVTTMKLIGNTIAVETTLTKTDCSVNSTGPIFTTSTWK